MQKRCAWVTDDSVYIEYHDKEWGPYLPDGLAHSDTYLFEMLTLEGAQAGLNWLTILKRRADYAEAFASYDIDRVAAFTEDDVEHLMTSSGIIRNRLKINSVIKNAKAWKKVREEFGSFQAYVIDFFGEQQRINAWERDEDVPAWTEESKAWSKDLKKRGFSFVGPTICYAYMQAVGIVFDHTTDCEHYRQVSEFQDE